MLFNNISNLISFSSRDHMQEKLLIGFIKGIQKFRSSYPEPTKVGNHWSGFMQIKGLDQECPTWFYNRPNSKFC